MSNRYRDRDQYERSRPQYNKLRDNSYRSQHTHNDYYRSPTSSSARGGGYRNQDKGYSTGTKPLSAGQTPKSEKVRSVFLNPKVRQQLEDNSKKYTPYFIYFVTGIQVIVLLVSYILNYKNTSSVIADLHENFFIGPDTGTLITMGARYIPCMKDSEFSGECPYGIRGTVSPTTIPVKESGKVDENGKDQGKIGTLLKGAYYCSQNDICGFGGMKNQWFRFITAIFVHSGIAHIAFNLIFQIRTGLSLERDFGTWRIAIIYMASGIFGFIFEAKSLGNIPTVGCSGALYGLLACILLDLIQNWKLVVHPIRDLIKLIVIIILSFSIGFLPYFDNFAHIGGFIMGFLTGLIFLPSIAFSENGGRIKKILQFVAIVVSVFLFFWEIKSFYNNEDGCEWCKNLNCAPFIDKCKN
ncbi:rhomboid-domain-containing protein [Neocallimastix sp. 'constans']